MKRIFLSLIASAFLVAGALRAQEPSPDTLPTLRGAEAVAQLKQNGQYESLREAVNAAQEENAQANKADSLDGFGETTKLLAADGATDNQFGSSVAISGDTALVGAPLDNVGATYQGSVYVFIRNGTNWVLQQKLTAADGGAEDFFGASVAISGDTAVVAAVGDHTGANIYQGSAYVFVRSGTTWTQQQKLLAADGAAGDFFGTDLAVEGDTAVIGTPREDEGTTPGSAYVFVRSGTSWTLQQQLIAPNGVASDRFGSGVAISGETIVVNAVWDDVGANTDQGSAYVFVRTGSAWAPQQQLVAGDGAADEHFGSSVAISGDTAVIGAAGDNASQGSAYVFVRNGVSWTQEQKLTAADGAANDRFGYPVEISGNTIVIGADRDAIGANNNQGSAYVFTRSGMVWTQRQKLEAADGAAGDIFGCSIAISGSHVIAGARWDDVNDTADQGSAYVFRVLGGNWSQETFATASDGAAGDGFGANVAISGDTAIVGASEDDVAGNSNQGAAYVFVRSGTAWIQQQKLLAGDGAAVDHFGISVAISGDTAVVGAHQDNVGANFNQGSAYVFVRSGSLWTAQQQLLATDGSSGDGFGSSVAISGQTAVVGALHDDVSGVTNQGSAYVFARTDTGWTQQLRLTAPDGAAGDFFGSSVAISGDVIVAGARGDDVGTNTDRGSAYVFVRSGNTWAPPQKVVASDGAAEDEFGSAVAISGETVVAGARFDDVGANSNQGSAYVFVRNGATWTQQRKLLAADGTAGDEFGGSVAVSGETVVVGALADDVGANTNQGTAYVFDRTGTAWTERERLTGVPAAALDLFGSGVGISGDHIVVGALQSDAPAADQGAAYFFVNTPLSLVGVVSRKTHGAAGAFEIPLPLAGDPGVECRSSGGAHTLVIFMNKIVSGNATVTAGTGSVSGSPTFGANTMTVNLTGVADRQTITVTLSGLTDSFGQVLPNTDVSMNVLVGDTNADRSVNSGDAQQTRNRSGQVPTLSTFRSDFNADGTINSGDASIVRSRSGNFIP